MQAGFPARAVSAIQLMDSIEWHASLHAPTAWNLLPDVDDVRPKACPTCRRPSKRGIIVDLHGHGVRWRAVVVGPAIAGRCSIEECWSRRYRCTLCSHTCTVLPVGVMPRYLYSTFAIVIAFVLTAAEPLGNELTDALAYKRQGMNLVRARKPGVDWRWRSIGRWKRRISTWWPMPDVPSLLAMLARRSTSDDLSGRLEAAARSHVRWGQRM